MGVLKDRNLRNKEPEISTSESEQQPVQIIKSSKKIKKSVKDQRLNNKAHLLVEWQNQDQFIKKTVTTNSLVLEYNKSIKEIDLTQYCSDLQGVFVNLDWEKPNKSLELLDQIELNDKVVQNGIMFVWVDKQYIKETMEIMDKKRFHYVENFQVVIMDQSKANSLGRTTKKTKINQFMNNGQTDQQNLQKVQATQIFQNQDYTYFKKTKRILYMFRKQLPKTSLELRHQRTSDSIFTIVKDTKTNALVSDHFLRSFVYGLIETLLPKATYEKGQKKYKLLEILGNKETREGWLKVIPSKSRTE